MDGERRKPPPRAGGNGSHEFLAWRLNGSKGTPNQFPNQDFPPDLDPRRHSIIAEHFFGLRPGAHGGWQPIGDVATRVVDKLRFQRQVKRLHELGPRPVGELLKELAEHSGESNFMEARLAAFAALDPSVVRALGGDKFPPTLTVVQP